MSDIVLPIQLTFGWPPIDKDSLTAKVLHGTIKENPFIKSNDDYQKELKDQLEHVDSACVIRLDQLLRRNANGFADINKFTGALLNIWKDLSKTKSCSIDIFAYAFLKHAKNYDLFMKPEQESINELKDQIKYWKLSVQALEDFERLGQGLESKLKKVYLEVRVVVSRPSARDEQRTLAILLVSGPRTLYEISEDLGLNYSLNRRIITALQITGVIGSRVEVGETRYFIKDDAIPIALFMVREIIGLDLLSMVTNIKECSNG